MGFNRGEWSETYGVLLLLVRPTLSIVNSNLQIIDDALYKVKAINVNVEDGLKYAIAEDLVYVYIENELANEISLEEIIKYKDILLNEIRSADTEGTGSFRIEEIDEFLDRFSNGKRIKAKSKDKSDVYLSLNNMREDSIIELSYSVKSMLGGPATIMNSSSHTNVKYLIKGLNNADINYINHINTTTKMKDRIAAIVQLGGSIEFDSIVSSELDYNLRMIDSNMPEYMANALLYSYTNGIKSFKDAFIESNTFLDENHATKKIGDFLDGISFGFIPSKKWDGKRQVTGGIIVITKDGDLLVLDLTYYKDHVLDYLINETKFDTPSSHRYHMLELSRESDGNVYFTLNIQIRYK